MRYFRCFFQLSIRQCQKQAIPYTFIQVSSTITNAALTILMLEFYQTDLVEKRILAILISNVFVALLSYLIYRKRVNNKKFYFLQYKTAFFYVMSFGFPMIFHHGSFFIKGQLDRIFIFHRFSEAELGLYAMSANCIYLISFYFSDK